MANRYNIVISATTQGTAMVRALKDAVRNLLAPITNIKKAGAELGKELGVKKIADDFGGLAGNVGKAVKNISGMGGVISGAIGLSSIGAVALYARQWVTAGSATLRTAAILDIASDKLQNLQGAAKLAGLAPEDMTQGLKDLGTTLQDARWGRNQGALLMMNRLGIQLKTTKTGAIDTAASLGDLADVISNMKAPVQTKMLIAQTFGVEALFSMLLKGRKAMEDYERQAAKIKPPLTEEDQRQADKYRQEIDALGSSFEDLGNSIMRKAMPGLGAVSSLISQINKNAADNIRKRGFFGALEHGAGETAKDAGHIATVPFRAAWDTGDKGTRDVLAAIGSGIAGAFAGKNRYPTKAPNVKTEKEFVDSFKKMGLTDAQAKGMVANMAAESGLDPRAVGDNGKAKGLLQWHADRQKNYERWAKENGAGSTIDTASISDQQRFAVYEITKGAEKQNAKRFMAAQNAETAGAVYSADVVRPADRGGEAVRRGDAAARMDSQFGNAATKPALADAWKNTPPPTVNGTLKIQLSGVPAGTKAEIVSGKGPVITTLKVDYSMPDYAG